MSFYQKAGFAIFLIIALILIATGGTYLTAPSIMPYHLTAMESTWDALPPGIKVMSLNFMKSVSAGFLSTGIAVLLLLAIPYRKGETWSATAILILILTQVGIIAVRTFDVASHTAANPPLTPQLIVLALAIAGFILSLFSSGRLTGK